MKRAWRAKLLKRQISFSLEMMWTSACKWFFCEGWPFGDSWILSDSSLENGDISQLPQNRKGLRWWWEWKTSVWPILYARVACNHGRCCEFSVYSAPFDVKVVMLLYSVTHHALYCLLWPMQMNYFGLYYLKEVEMYAYWLLLLKEVAPTLKRRLFSDYLLVVVLYVLSHVFLKHSF